MLLAGDLGGTKVRLAVFDEIDAPPVAEDTLRSSRYDSLAAACLDFLSGHDVEITHAVFGVAGPVVGGQARITNLPWTLKEAELAADLQVEEVRLLNDLEAVSYSIPQLKDEDTVTLNAGQRRERGAIAVLAPGTGLGEGFLTWDGTAYRAHPSEGGHSSFAPTNELQYDLLRYLWGRYQHVSFERVCSGKGLPNLYEFLRDTGRHDEPDWLAEQMAAANDPNPVIAEYGLSGQSALCAATLDLFVTIMAGEAGNLALKVYATGGIYLAGGIPVHILPKLEAGQFMRAFSHKGRMSELLEPFPVHVVTKKDPAILGAACFAASLAA